MQYQIERADRRRRQKALYITVCLQIALLLFLVFGGQLSLRSILPSSVQEALGMEAPAEEVTAEAEVVAARP